MMAFTCTLRVRKKPITTLNRFHHLLVTEAVLDDLLVLDHSLYTLSDLPDRSDAVAKRLSDARGPILDLWWYKREKRVYT